MFLYFPGMLISGCLRWSNRRYLQDGGMLRQTAHCLLVYTNMVGFLYGRFGIRLRFLLLQLPQITNFFLLSINSFDLFSVTRLWDVHHHACWSLPLLPGESWSSWWQGHWCWAAHWWRRAGRRVSDPGQWGLFKPAYESIADMQVRWTCSVLSLFQSLSIITTWSTMVIKLTLWNIRKLSPFIRHNSLFSSLMLICCLYCTVLTMISTQRTQSSSLHQDTPKIFLRR